MTSIKPLESLSRDEVRELAQSAADRSEPMEHANPFDPDSRNGLHFQRDYQERSRDLCET